MSNHPRDQPEDKSESGFSTGSVVVPRRFVGNPYHENLLWAVVLLGLVWRFGLCLWRPPTSFLFSDPKRHWLNGERLFAPDLMGASDPLSYQVYIFVLRELTAENVHIIALGCGLLSVATAWAFYRAGREFGLSPIAALYFYVVVAFLPSLTVIYHYFMPETLLLFLVAIGLWASARHLRKRCFGSFLASVVVWTLASLTKASVVPLACACVTYLWFSIPPRRLCWLAAAGSVAALLLLPSSLRTRRYLGFVAPLGSAWIPVIQHQSDAETIRVHWGKGLWQFSSPSCYVQPLAPLSPWMLERANTGKIVDIYPPQQGEEGWRRERMAKRTGGIGAYIRRAWENALLLLFAPSWPDSDGAHVEGRLNFLLRWIWGPLIFCVLWGNVREFSRGYWALLPVATSVFALFLLLQPSVTMEGRYRKPLEPLLIMNFVWLQSLRQREELKPQRLFGWSKAFSSTGFRHLLPQTSPLQSFSRRLKGGRMKDEALRSRFARAHRRRSGGKRLDPGQGSRGFRRVGGQREPLPSTGTGGQEPRCTACQRRAREEAAFGRAPRGPAREPGE